MAFAYAGLYSGDAKDATNALLVSTLIIVYVHNTLTPAVIYTDRTKITATANPVLTDAYGNLKFYADPGLYDLTTPSGGLVTVVVSADALEYLQTSSSSTDLLAVGEETFSRTSLNNLSGGTGNRVYLTYWTARKTELVTQVRTITDSTAAALTPTLCRIGLYQIDVTSGAGTLVASIPNDTSLWGAASTAYTKTLSVGYNKTAGQRYATGLVCTTNTTAPTWWGRGRDSSPAGRTEASYSPRIAGYLILTDLPNSFVDSSVNIYDVQSYSVLLP